MLRKEVKIYPRQHARLMKVGKVTFKDAYRAVKSIGKCILRRQLPILLKIIPKWRGQFLWPGIVAMSSTHR